MIKEGFPQPTQSALFDHIRSVLNVAARWSNNWTEQLVDRV